MLTSIGGELSIAGNQNLSDISGLSGLNTINGDLYIGHNPVLNSLSGIDNLNAGSIANLSILENTSLSLCNVASVCAYLPDPSGTITIFNNAGGCDSPVEVADACGVSLPCPPAGNLFMLSQADVDSFPANYPQCSHIQGDVRICGSDITDLSGLSQITSVSGNLFIGDPMYGGNPLLSDLGGLSNLEAVGGYLWVESNTLLFDFSGLSKLSSVKLGLTAINNQSLVGFSGLDQLKAIPGDLSIYENHSLLSLTGLENVISVTGDVDIYGNSLLTILTGLNGLTSIGGDLSIYDCPNLANLTGLENLTSVGGNLRLYDNYSLNSLNGLGSLNNVGIGMLLGPLPQLTNISALNNLNSVGYLVCRGNPLLNSLAPLENINSVDGLLISGCDLLTDLTGLDNLTMINGDLDIYYNNALAGITELNNVTSVNGYVRLFGNPLLTSLTGLDHVSAGSISDLYIFQNPSLSKCEVQSVCDYLGMPGKYYEIFENAERCSSREKVMEACTEGIDEFTVRLTLRISPNPSAETILVETFEMTGIYQLTIENTSGQQVLNQSVNGASTTVDISNLPKGLFVLKVYGGKAFGVCKFIKE